ncbi:conserved hypothetical protein [Leishmania braziliensis MHOM/BR/75/M2904]|uniref:Uncharacterized protein n=1 Tax=Leishmania braziliensis TaxID=5660 RepID=A4HP16_LEIBR|nr:conserved hypothetical protein [Leishmania braziliensis MHOM/BR/75/M2904]CAJ2481319.1 unnamed protein product [Leishmania braziliensis]CAM43923.1 conserved hypothetical protein [Leishmania braziliensis MHOM/BR/75/M2904]
MSATQSAAESGVSSLQRSGFSITVGDTKSIVLALQALQSKIRSLEQDRDFHQDQYEVALQAHERYKLDMERQMEQERGSHRKREADLLELLRKAREERTQLEDTLNGSKKDLGGFRRELEQMIATEKELSSQRESKINMEVAKLRADIKEEQTHRAALLVTVDKLKAERESALRTNEQLRMAMDDLLTRYEQLQRHRPSPQAATHRRSSSGLRGEAHLRAAPATGAYPRPLVSSRTRSPRHAPSRELRRLALSARQRTVLPALHHNYEDPTCNSILRDVRVVPDEAPPCPYPSVNSSLHQPQPDPVGTTGSANTARSRQALLTQTTATPSRSGRPSVARRPSESGVAGPSEHHIRAINEVEAQLRKELEALQHRYDDTIVRGASEEVPREVLAAALQRISALIEQKKEQLKLLKEARMELDGAASLYAARGATTTVNGGGDGSPSTWATQNKHTRRTLLVNELRSLLAESAKTT